MSCVIIKSRAAAVLLATGLLILIAATHRSAIAQTADESAESFYRDRTLTIISGSDVGGGYDAYARLISRHLPNFLPGNVHILVQNLPAGGGILATNTLFNVSAKDGTVFGSVPRGVMSAPLLDPRPLNYQYDARKFNWLLSLNSEAGLIIVSSAAPQLTADDLYRDELTVGGNGPSTEIFPRLLKNLFGMKIRIVSGYKGSADAYLALERGEVLGRISTGFDKAVLTPWLAEGRVRLLLSISLNQHPYFPQLPLITRYIKSDEERSIVELVLAEQLAGRPVMMPPGVPINRVLFMRAAMARMVSSEAFLADAGKLNLDIDTVGGDEISRIMERIYTIPDVTVARTRQLISAER